jgi:MFS family permease
VIFSALAGLALVLVVWTLRLETAPRGEAPSASALLRAFRNRHFTAGLALMALPSLLFGILSVLGPLHLSAAGWGAAAIGGVWLVAAALETVQAPLVGRLMDRRGKMLPVRVTLAIATLASLALAADSRPLFYVPLIVIAASAYGVLFTPAFALIADGAEHSRLAQGMAFGFMNAAWAVGAVIGPAVGGAIASSTGDWIPFLLAGGACALALVAVLRFGRLATAGTASRPLQPTGPVDA